LIRVWFYFWVYRRVIANISQAGQWVFSPSGLPISVLTGKMAADRVIKVLKKKKEKKEKN